MITPNWDTCIDDFVTRNYEHPTPPVFHVHGEAGSSSTLCLPSEVVEEPYRDPEENAGHGRMAGSAMHLLQDCECLVVYGLSFDPLDAELGVITRDAFAGTDNPKQVIVVDKNPTLVVDRLRLLVPSGTIFRRFYPESLDDLVTYSAMPPG